MTVSSSMWNTFRQRLHGRERLIGFWSSMTNSTTVEIAGLAGYDWLLLDGEHAPTSLPLMAAQLQALNGSPVAIVGRPAENNVVMIKQLLDVGFYNLLIPFVESGDDARKAVAATRYPPEGIRGVAGLHRSNRYGTLAGYNESVNDNISVIVQIESRAGIEAFDDIVAVDGVDGIFIGPSDLSASLGHLGNPNHPDVQRVIRDLHERTQAHGKATGILAPIQDDARRYLDWGFHFVAVGTDMGVFKQAVFSLREAFR